jgi:glycosyltransferase involved in cell wall biosynthesis
MESISVIVPLYNEKESLRELHSRVSDELKKFGVPAEIVYVDDGSTDGSADVLKEIQILDNRVKIIRFRRNFGKSAALSAAFHFATGEVIVTLDADLQDEPSEMHKLIERLEGGADLVSGWKRDRKDPLSKRIPSKIFNFVTAFLTGVPLHDMNCGFKAYRRAVVEEIKVYGEMHRYIPVLASYRGFQVTEVPVIHNPRKFGRSKFGATRLLGGFFDLLTVIMLTRYNKKPLHAFGIIGLTLWTIGLAIEVYLSIGWMYGRWIEDRPAFMLGILLLIIGLQFVLFGLLAEMIAYSAKREDDYSIREILVSGQHADKESPIESSSGYKS